MNIINHCTRILLSGNFNKCMNFVSLDVIRTFDLIYFRFLSLFCSTMYSICNDIFLKILSHSIGFSLHISYTFNPIYTTVTLSIQFMYNLFKIIFLFYFICTFMFTVFCILLKNSTE